MTNFYGRIGVTDTVPYRPWSGFASSHRGKPDFQARIHRCPICQHQIGLAHDEANDEDLVFAINLSFNDPLAESTGFALL